MYSMRAEVRIVDAGKVYKPMMATVEVDTCAIGGTQYDVTPDGGILQSWHRWDQVLICSGPFPDSARTRYLKWCESKRRFALAELHNEIRAVEYAINHGGVDQRWRKARMDRVARLAGEFAG